jgi:hypothetical protein
MFGLEGRTHKRNTGHSMITKRETAERVERAIRSMSAAQYEGPGLLALSWRRRGPVGHQAKAATSP